MDFMRDGGAVMWVMVASAIATLAVAATRPRGGRPVVLLAGAILAIAEGLLGMAFGMQAVAAHYTRFPDHAGAIAEGLRELSNNGILGAALAVALGGGALLARARLAPTNTPASAVV